MSAPASPPMAKSATALSLVAITKRFGPVLANDAVDLDVAAGTIHGIIGENGAGKSTLVSIIYGFHRADSGTISVDGERAEIRASSDAIALGIGMVHQHFVLVPTLTVLENAMLGAEGGLLLAEGRARTGAELTRLAETYGLKIDIDATVGSLPVGLQQRVEILKALLRGARILILDEPTGVLSPTETDSFFEVLRALRERGVTVILITHKLREILAVTDTVSIMRGGRMVAHRRTADTSREELAELMVGRRVALEVTAVEADRGPVLLCARALGWRDARGLPRVQDVSLELRAGEIVGLAGVSGNGQSELLDLLSGIAPLQDGSIEIDERVIDRGAPCGPAEMRRLGLAHVPEDRHRRGLVLNFEARESAVLGHHCKACAGEGLLISPAALTHHCAQLMERFDVRPPDPRLRTANFSGGNQQKLVLAREIDQAPRIILIGQPTRGIDIGGIAFIHEQLMAMKARGCAILVVSVELEEILALSDRIAVMTGGRIVGILPRSDADTGRIGLMMAGHGPEDAGPEDAGPQDAALQDAGAMTGPAP